jgi:hypothetical protein
MRVGLFFSSLFVLLLTLWFPSLASLSLFITSLLSVVGLLEDF